MSISATAVRFDEHAMWVELSRTGLHWEDIDEDISIASLLAGRGDMTRKTERAA